VKVRPAAPETHANGQDFDRTSLPLSRGLTSCSRYEYSCGYLNMVTSTQIRKNDVDGGRSGDVCSELGKICETASVRHHLYQEPSFYTQTSVDDTAQQNNKPFHCCEICTHQVILVMRLKFPS
jgi:hypothetical protein